MKKESAHQPSLWIVIAAFTAVYVIWGSTYLGIRYAVESIPPFIMAGTRNLFAGLILYAFMRVRGAEAPSLMEWRDAIIAGALMLMIGNGCVTWAEKSIPSGITALLVALTPAWMVIFDWIRPNGVQPGLQIMVGLVTGFTGVAVLMRNHLSGSGTSYGWGIAALFVSSIGWSLGSIFNRSARKPSSAILAGAMQLTAGGCLLSGVGVLNGEWKIFSPERITSSSVIAWLYLMVAGSVIAFSAYIWLLQVRSTSEVSTNGFVNPLIAVLLGCTIGHEAFSSEMLIASVLIVAAVVLILRGSPVPQPSLTAQKTAT